MSLGNYTENAFLNHMYGSEDYTPAATLYISAHTADPGETGTNGEVSGNNYARVAVTNNLTNWPAASNGSKSNGDTITFPTPSGTWGPLTHLGVWDAASGGNFLGGNALDTPTASVVSGDTVQFDASALTLTLVGNGTTAWISYYKANGLLDLMFGGQTFTPPAMVYFALNTGSPGITGANEVSGTDYARVGLTNNPTNFPSTSSGSKTTGAPVAFPTPGAADWGTASHWSTWDAPTGGNFIGGGALSVSKPIGAGDTLTLPTGGPTITLD